jgi:branched-chain amino acid transport system substrate-binding protein
MRSPRLAVSVFIAVGLALLAVRPSSAQETIRVGFLGPLTGVFAQAGKDMNDGLKLALEQVNYQVAGRKVELFSEDTEGNPSVAAAKYRKLVSHDRINVLTGILLSHIGYSLVPMIDRDQLPTLMFTTPDDLTKRKLPKWRWIPGWSSGSGSSTTCASGWPWREPLRTVSSRRARRRRPARTSSCSR